MLTRGAGLAVIVHHRPGCPSSVRLRLALTLHRVPFVTRRLETPGAAADGGLRAGVSPTVLVGERWLVGPSWRQVVVGRWWPPVVRGRAEGRRCRRSPRAV